MYNNNYYWQNKNELSKKAKNHVKLMNEKYKNVIDASVSATKVYNDGDTKPARVFSWPAIIPELCFVSTDTVSALFEAASSDKESKIAVLNFASYKFPGGGFIVGSRAQEECLCHASTLYNVISEFSDYYEWNKAHLNKALYLNRALYSPGILFTGDNDSAGVFADVITCAAPNKTTAQKYQNVSDETNLESLTSRIKFILDIAEENNVDTLILGAFGCGVFGQDPSEVANAFAQCLDDNTYSFSKVIFAVPSSFHAENFKAFSEKFGA